MREVFFAGVDKPESIEGMGVWSAVIDEARNIKKETVWTETVRPMLGDAVNDGGGRCVIISTPKTKLHWFSRLIQRVIDGKEGDDYRAFIKTTLEGGNIPAEEIEKARQTLPPAIFERNYMANDKNLEGLVYSEYGDHNLIQSMADLGWRPSYYTGAIDWGDNFAVLVTGHSWHEKAEQNHIVRKAHKSKGLDIESQMNILKNLKAQFGITEWFIDHNRPEFAREMVRPENGLGTVTLARKDIAFGLRLGKALLFDRPNMGPRTKILEPECQSFIEEVENYELDPNTELPIKENDHLMDCWRYDNVTKYPVETERTRVYNLI